MIDIQTTETMQEQLQAMRVQAQAQGVLLDEYKTELCCLDKPDLVARAKAVQLASARKYTAKTPNYVMIGHLMTVKKRELGHEGLLDRIDAIQAQIASQSGGK